MEFDVKRLEKLTLSKTKKTPIDLTEDEIKFMSNIFNSIINSDDYESMIKYLAGINSMSISDIKLIKNIYAYYLASRDEKMIYNDKMKQLRKEKNKKGFIDFSVILSITVFICVIGVTLGVLLYK